MTDIVQYPEDMRDRFNFIKLHTAHLEDDPVFSQYFTLDEYNQAVSNFFSVSDLELKQLYILPYPIHGRIFFNEMIIKSLVQELPELLLSILKYGIPKLLTLFGYESRKPDIPSEFSYINIRKISETILYNWKCIGNIVQTGTTRAEIRAGLSEKVRMIPVQSSNYDILGALQLNLTAQVQYLAMYGIPFSNDEVPIIPLDHKKRELLLEVSGYMTSPNVWLAQLLKPTDTVTNISEKFDAKLSEERFIEVIDGILSGKANLSIGTNSEKAYIANEVVTDFVEEPELNEIILLPANPIKRRNQNRITLNGKELELVQNANFDFLYWIAWCEQSGKPQLQTGIDIDSSLKAQILESCTEKMFNSRFSAAWTQKYNDNKKWDAQSQINKLVGFELIGSSDGYFSITEGYHIELHPYPIK